jgi:hypothetical protein
MVSAMSLVLISFNRYVKICHRPLFRQLFSARRNLHVCLSLWLLAAVLNAPALVVGIGNFDVEIITFLHSFR